MTLQLSVEPPEAPFLVGGSMPLTLMLRNRGSGPEPVPAWDGRLPFEYAALSEDASRLVAGASVRRKELAAAGGLVPEAAPRMAAIEPGGFMYYQQDLADLLLSPLPPAAYQLEAAYRLPDNSLVRAERVPFEIAGVRPEAVAQGLHARGTRLIMVEAQKADDGSISLRKWESPATHPAMGRFRTLLDLPQGRPLTSLALAMEAEEQYLGIWRWVAWTLGDALFAAVLRSTDTTYSFGPLETGVQAPALLPLGYQFAHGGSLFVITGMDRGKRKLRLVSVPADDEQSSEFHDLALPGVPDVPPETTMISVAEDKYELGFCWTLHGRAASGVVAARIDPATGAVISAPHTVFTTERYVVAVRVPPLAEDGVRSAYLLAPKAVDAPFTAVYLNPRDPAQRRELDLPAMTPMQGEPVSQWILASAPAESAPVLAVVSGRLWAATPGAAWQDTGLDAGSAPVRLWPLPGGQYWVSWLDPVDGYVFHRLA